MIGQVLDHYSIEAPIGTGGMGVVYKAYDVRLERPVAIKLLARATEDAARAILREARTVSSLNHPHICTIYEVGESGGQAYIVMEYVEGRPLNALIPSDGLTTDCAVVYALQITDAVAHAHDHGVIHRDLKTANIVVTPEGRVKVLDFGLAVRSSPAQLDAVTRALTSTEGVAEPIAGTLVYMPPEVLRGEPADARSDIWAIGVILYEMLSGRLPFAGRTTAEICTEILREAPWPLAASVDAGLRGVVSRCLMKEPRQRYSRASDIRAALETIQCELEGPAASRGALRPAQATIWQRRRLRSALLSAVAVVAVGALSFAVPQTRRLVLPASSALARDAVAAKRAVAVFPIRAVDNLVDVDYIARGLTEALAARLVQSQVHVASTDAIERARKTKSVQQAARELGVAIAVTGTVQQIGGKLRIMVNVEDATGGQRLTTQEVSGDPLELLSLEDRLHAGLVDTFGLAQRGESGAAAPPPTANARAYDLYLKGRFAAWEQSGVEGAVSALSLYEQAVRDDPRFALAYAAMSDVLLRLYTLTRENAWAGRARFAADQAHGLDPNRPEVHLARGKLYNAFGKTSDAIAALKRALELAPNYDKAYRELGNAYAAAGLGEEAMQSLHKAAAINPYDWEHHNELGVTALELGRYPEAVEGFRKVIELEPARVAGYSNLGAIYLHQGEFEMAAAAFEQALKLEAHATIYTNLGVVYANTGRIPEAFQMYHKAVELEPNETRKANLADGYRWLGQHEKAASFYDEAIALAYKRLQVNPRDADAMANLAQYYAKKGEARTATDFIRKARDIQPEHLTFVYYEALVHQLVGRTPEALDALREAFRRGYRPSSAEADPDLKSLRSNPRFQELLKNFGGGSR